MKIMIGADTYPPVVSGAGRFTRRLAEGLARRGHEVRVLCPSDSGRPATERAAGVTVHRLVSHRSLVHARLRVCLPGQIAGPVRDLVAQQQPDVIHVQSHFPVGRALVRAATVGTVPLVATNHFMPENVVDYLPAPRSVRRSLAAWSWLDVARIFGQADVVTAPTPRAADLLERSTGLRDVLPISCGIDLDHYRCPSEATGSDSDVTPRRVLFVGRLDEEKRVDELIRAMAVLPTAQPTQLVVIGDGRQRAAWTALAHRLGVADRVSFRGFVSEAELVAAYASCTVFCMPGVAELQSLVTLEAMAAGRPVVAADAMALPHLVRSGRTGWLYPPGDVPRLAARLASILDDPGLARRMGQAGRRLAALHSEEATLDAFEEVYARVCPVRQPVLAAAA